VGRIAATTDLSVGTDLLVGDLLIARLEHPTGTKTFRLQVTVN
jgi:hypothetical protein